MNIFNRITATVSATVDKAVSQVENHEAIVDAALRDTRSKIAQARVRFARVQRDGVRLRKKADDLAGQELRWEGRARSAVSDGDESTALQCVSRRNACREQQVQTRDALAKHESLESSVGDSVARMEQRLEELTQQRNMMRSRHSAADAMRVINKIENASDNGIDDTFERWEMCIAETEYVAGIDESVDALDVSFTKVENEQALRADLDALLAETTVGDKERSNG